MMTRKEAVIAKLLEFDARLTKLEEMLGLNSKNSSKHHQQMTLLKKKSQIRKSQKSR